ncbi:transcriptional regulator with XRE-family HTH domain [Rhodococcus sp. 27YEA15]|uniref:helix-turn-helix domain-containing protein n=1 Tax=Rhodococcus sp. 27YEA15 TaxID=3156259 RepID=UPI003C7AB9C5
MGTPLGDFIRAKRDATLPADLGLPDDGRRRAPGLRRTELAARAEISVEYLTRIEQGRDRNPTLPVLNSIADGLSLDVTGRRHLHYLAKIAGGACAGQRNVAPAPLRREARAAALETLRLLEPDGVAMVTNKLGDVLASTRAFHKLMEPTGLLDPDQPNLVRYLFTDARSHDVLINWDQVADVQAFDLWHAPTIAASEWLTAEIAPQAGPDFTARVNQMLPPVPHPWEIRLPDGVITRWQREVLDIPAEPEQQIVILMPADNETRVAFASHRGENITPLRAV